MGNTVRFCVATSEGLRAASWRLWTQKSEWGEEIYFLCRELGGTIHTSFHASGDWHTTFTSEAAAKLPQEPLTEPKSRRIEEWPRPSQIEPGIVLAYKILTPWSSPTSPIDSGTKKIVQIPNAAVGCANETMILLLQPELSLELRNCVLVSELPLADGGRLMIANRQVRMPEIKIPKRQLGRYFEGKSRSDLEQGNIRVLIFADDENGHKMIIDGAAEIKS